MTSILDVIGHYQRSIEKSAHDEARLLHCIEKLYKLPITVEHLQQTGIGKTVNALRKYDKEVGVAAKALVAKWKAMVAAEEELADVEDVNRPTDNYPSNSDSENYNGSHHSRENQNGMYNRQNHHQPSSRNEKVNDADRREKKHRENGKEESHSRSRNNTIEIKKAHNILSDRHNHEKNSCGSSSNEIREKYASIDHRVAERDHGDRRREEKFKCSTEHSSRKVRTPEPAGEITPQPSDDDFCEDEDDEKLVIDTEQNKERIEEMLKLPSRDSKSHHKSSSKRSHNEEHLKESEHQHRKRHKTDERDKGKDGRDIVKKSSTSKSQHDVKVEQHENDELQYHKSDKKDPEKSSERSNGKHKSSSSSKSKHREKSRDKDAGRQISIKVEAENINKEKNSVSSRSSSKKSSKRKHHSPEGVESDTEEVCLKKGKAERNSTEEVYPKKVKVERNSTEEVCSKKIKAELKSMEEFCLKKVKDERNATEAGMDSTMCNLSFEEALGMIAPPSKMAASKLKSPKANGVISTSSVPASTSRGNTSSSNTQSKTPTLLTSKVKLEPLDPKLSLELPTISPNYKPMPLNPTVMDCVFSNNVNKTFQPVRRLMTDDEALQSGIQSKTIRTKIYSGVRSGATFQVTTLHQLCIRVLQKNIDALEYTGGVPFEILKSVLELATPEQLQTFEEYNPYLLNDTDELWRVHCSRRYKTKKRDELESWREMFVRCKGEEEERLSMLTKNISFQQKQIAAPIKRTQLAYVDVDVKPPRNIIRKQEQYGTKGKLIATPAARVEALSKINPSVAKIGDTRLRTSADVRDYAQASSHIRPKKAPLMQKTLQLMKGRFKR